MNNNHTIGIISPSFGGIGQFEHRLKNAKLYFSKKNIKLKLASNAHLSNSYVSSTIENRVNDIHEMFLDKEVNSIICSTGGNHSNQLLKYIDYDIIKNNPKNFIGYSDITVLHYAFLKKANLKTYYGPCLIPEFGEYPKPFKYTSEYFFDSIFSDSIIDVKASKYYTDEFLDWNKKKDIIRPRIRTKSNGHYWLKEGHIKAPIIGGCLGSLNHLFGTEYWINPEGNIFFIDIPEEKPGIGMNLSDIDSLLTDFYNVGIFDSIKGLIIGRPYRLEKNENDIKELFLKFTSKYDYPILFNANLGHTDPKLTIKYKSIVLLNSKKDTFEINQTMFNNV